MSKNINKNLNLESLQKFEQELDKRITVELKDGEFVIEIDKFFRTTKIENMIEDFVGFMQRASENQKEVDKDMLKRFVRINQMLVLKHFTNVEVPDDDLKMIKMCEILIDAELLDEIDQNIPQSEKDKLNKIIDDRVKNMKKMQSMYGELLLESTFGKKDNKDDE